MKSLFIVEVMTENGDFEFLGVCEYREALRLLNGRAGILTGNKSKWLFPAFTGSKI